MPRTLRHCLIEQAIPPQLDFLFHALDSLRPAGDDLIVDDEMLAETRRVFADLRRLLAGMPLHRPDPVAPITRGTLRRELRDALSLYIMFVEEQRQRTIARRKEARKSARLEKNPINLSPRPFAFIE